MVCKCYHADKNFLGEIGVCWGTKECESCSCRGDEAKCDFYDYVRERVKKPITNADKIRAMTDEEMADYLAEKSTAPSCMGKCHKDYEVYGELRTFCHDCWLDWLKQEVESDA